MAHPKHSRTVALKRGTLVFEVSPGLLQVGSSPGSSILLSSLTDKEVRWVRNLRVKSSRQNQLDERQAEILRLLDAAGLIDGGANPLSHLRVQLVGLDRIGTRIAPLLVRAGVRSLDLQDRRLVDARVEDLYPLAMLGRVRQSAMRDLIKERRPNFLISKSARPDLVVATSDRVWDQGLMGRLLSEDLNHLPIVRDQDSVTVGPLVAPGTTPCTMCADMRVQDQIPVWPQMALEMERTPLDPLPDYLCAAASALAVSMISAVACGLPPVEGGQPIGRPGGPSYSVRITRFGVTTESWEPHPRCSCLANLETPAEASGAA